MAILKKKEKKIYMALLCLSTIHFELYILIFTIVYIENGVESILTPLKKSSAIPFGDVLYEKSSPWNGTEVNFSDRAKPSQVVFFFIPVDTVFRGVTNVLISKFLDSGLSDISNE